jgi:hypothetical protein
MGHWRDSPFFRLSLAVPTKSHSVNSLLSLINPSFNAMESFPDVTVLSSTNISVNNVHSSIQAATYPKCHLSRPPCPDQLSAHSVAKSLQNQRSINEPSQFDTETIFPPLHEQVSETEERAQEERTRVEGYFSSRLTVADFENDDGAISKGLRRNLISRRLIGFNPIFQRLQSFFSPKKTYL